jgi:hypothetical protein
LLFKKKKCLKSSDVTLISSITIIWIWYHNYIIFCAVVCCSCWRNKKREVNLVKRKRENFVTFTAVFWSELTHPAFKISCIRCRKSCRTTRLTGKDRWIKTSEC